MELKAAIILLCALFGVANAGYALGRCPNHQVVKNFNLGKFTGRWYGVAKFGAYYSKDTYKCNQAIYTRSGDGIEVINAYKDSTTSKIGFIKGFAKPVDKSGDAKLEVTFNSNPGPYWVLDTDYDSYLIEWGCRNYFIANYQSGWILSRTPKLDAATQARVNQKLQEFGLSITQFTTTVQDCNPFICDGNTCRE